MHETTREGAPVPLLAVRYANCWEDAHVLCRALEPRPGARILSVAAAGDNVLALVADGAEVVAADLSVPQLACLELRCAAFRRLSYDELLAFLGMRPSNARLLTYLKLVQDLSPRSREYWSQQRQDLVGGLAHAGRFESYFRFVRTRILPWIHSRRRIEELLRPREAAERREFYDTRWNTWRWRWLFRVFLRRLTVGLFARKAEYYRFVHGPVWTRIFDRCAHVLSSLPTHENPFLEYVLTGTFERALPRYLEPHRFDAVRAGLDRLTLHEGPIETAALEHGGDGFDGFNLSDVFEYLDPEICRAVYSTLLERGRPRARFAYWNTLVPHRCPDELADRVTPLTDLAQELFASDLCFLHCDFVVEEAR